MAGVAHECINQRPFDFDRYSDAAHAAALIDAAITQECRELGIDSTEWHDLLKQMGKAVEQWKAERGFEC